MNLPNKLTILRVILIPFFVFFLISPFFDGYGNYIALAIFIIASLTDMADGKLQENTILLPISANLWIRLQTSCLYALQ